MKAKFALTVAILMFGLPTPTWSGVLSGTVIAKSGDWSVRRSTDAMTDKPECVALHKDRSDLQVTTSEMYISEGGKGGVDAIIVRFDDQPAEGMRLATDSEKQISAIGITGQEFQELLAAKRLRYRILNLLGGMDDGDVDLSGLVRVHDVIVSSLCGQ